ncbi:hypothetical protein ERO13_A09G019300v2 [Gossypium hirsutum]|uniref:Uncharacterized protein At3g28850 n=2 Tax=Gossypium TaxID=3633 RepID=A0ABM2YUB5_GOSHI|nr:uncharacterized protein At3g28850-like [Gossypium hirsutum]KAB2064455.1 hypothetical protein ES319_A09G020400v1 [Gossypium barbadense]KAG4182040.1 hypothetical protein ERO13_A09G019300v2 [Gossypium hirsutum]
MGCASSRQKRCWHCRAPYSPVPRSYTMHVHHPAQHRGDSYHVVALTSTTLGNLKIESSHQSNGNNTLNVAAFNGNLENNGNVKEKKEQQSKGLSMIEAEVWSKMIEDKIPKVIPKTPIATPPGEPETINTWELMAGLEDLSPRPPSHIRSFSNGTVSQKPLWVQFEEEEEDQKSDSVITDFDPEIISSFRKTLEQLPSTNPFHLRLKKDKLVLYFTSLRGVRKTYEDCCHIRLILKTLGVRIDERDVSMHSGFKDELKELMGEQGCGGLPKVFIGKKYIGGADEIRQMHEEGTLMKAIEGCEMMDDDDIGPCEACGDIRFVPCETCSGSCKVYYEDDDENEDGVELEHEDGGEGDYGFQRCPDCNENGLIRCPICCY